MGAMLLVGCPDDETVTADAGGGAPAAHLLSTKGTVRVERAGKTFPAELGYLYLQDAVETGADGQAQVRFPGGRIVEVGPNARFLLGEERGGLVLEVARGLVLTRVPSQPGAAGEIIALSILTPFGMTRVGEGQNSVSVDVSPNGAQVEVLVGAVELVSRNGKSVNAEQGVTATLGVTEVTIAGREVKLSLVPVTVLSVNGKTELRKKDEKRWSAVGKKGSLLEPGDSVRVRSGRAELSPKGSDLQMTFDRGTEIVFDRSGTADGFEESKLDLTQGSLRLSMPRGKKSRVVVGGFELESDLGGQFSVVKTADGLEVRSLAGDLIARLGNKEQPVLAGQVVRLGAGGEVKVTTQQRSALVLPTRSGLRVFHAQQEDATLTWEGKGDFLVEVARDSGFKDLVVAGVVHEPEVTVPIPGRGSLFWRVLDSAGKETVDRGNAAFAPEAPQRDLARLRNEVPEGSEKTSIYYQDQDKPPAVTLTYKSEPGAVKYAVKVFKAGELDAPVVERQVKEERLALEAGALSEGSYVWSVTPLSVKGEELRGGRMTQLELVYDNSVPNLVIRQPRNGEAARSSVKVSGVAPVGAKVFANGRPLPLDAKNRFDGQASPAGRPPSIIFRMARSGGADVFTVRTLRRAR